MSNHYFNYGHYSHFTNFAPIQRRSLGLVVVLFIRFLTNTLCFTYIFKISISFLAAFLTLCPSFLLNFLQVYIFKVFLSFARNISQNSSLPETGKTCYTFIEQKVGIFKVGVLTTWRPVRGHTCRSPPRGCCNPSSPRVSDNQMAWQLVPSPGSVLPQHKGVPFTKFTWKGH